MKFIDLREAWVREMRNRLICNVVKVPTKDNPADFATKIHSPAEFIRQRAYFLTAPVSKPKSKPIKVLPQVQSVMPDVKSDCPISKVLGWYEHFYS